MRQQVTVVLVKSKTGSKAHFKKHELSGVKNSVWFPIRDVVNFFAEIEEIMVMCGVAHNITHVNRVSESAESDEYTVTYNTAQ